jgi:hypothetical protein
LKIRGPKLTARPPSGGRRVSDLRLFERQCSRPLVGIRRSILPFDQVAW